MKVTQERGHLIPTEFAERTLVTVHPSSLLRIPAAASKEEAFARFVQDLALLKAA